MRRGLSDELADAASGEHGEGMNPYADVDGVIDAWVRASGSSLSTEWDGRPARFFHIPGAPPFECFQVSVDPPQDGLVAVTARAVDTNDDTEHEMDQTWDGSVAELDAMLAIAIATVRQWRDRERSA